MNGPYFLNSEIFQTKNLTRVEPPKNPCILKSGGPIMELLEIKEGLAYCEWEDGYANFPVKCLYRLIEL